MNRQNGQDKFA